MRPKRRAMMYILNNKVTQEQGTYCRQKRHASKNSICPPCVVLCDFGAGILGRVPDPSVRGDGAMRNCAASTSYTPPFWSSSKLYVHSGSCASRSLASRCLRPCVENLHTKGWHRRLRKSPTSNKRSRRAIMYRKVPKPTNTRKSKPKPDAGATQLSSSLLK
jgi:hypothetical protein